MRIFAILDFEIPGILPFLHEAQALCAAHGYELFVPGRPNGAQGIVWNAAVQQEIDRSDAVIGCVDLPNANVGYELGYALASGKPMALTRRCAVLPKWVSESPLKGVMCEQRETAQQLVGLLKTAGDGHWLTYPATSESRPDDDWRPGRFLCPGDAADDIRSRCPTTWELVDQAQVMLETLRDWVTATPRAIWVIGKHDQGSIARDGDANAALAVIAGYYKGSGRTVHPFLQVHARDVVDLAQSARAFHSASELHDFIRAIPNAVGNWKNRVEADFLARWTNIETIPSGERRELEDHNPFISTQRLSLLPEKSRAAFKHLHPGAMRAGRSSESEAQRNTGRWVGITRVQLVTDLCEPTETSPADFMRLVLTADAGVGKTANIEWLLTSGQSHVRPRKRRSKSVRGLARPSRRGVVCRGCCL